MSLTGSSGIMRSANEEYLEILDSYIGDFIALKKDIIKAEESRDAIEANKNGILAEWHQFEKTKLPILDQYLKMNVAKEIEAREDTYTIVEPEYDGIMLMMSKIGDYELFFEISNKRSKLHPFVLLDVTPLPETE